jgi:hypothetical protein
MPQESTEDGLIKSPTDGQPVQPTFDYGSLSESNHRLLEEVLKLLEYKKGKLTTFAIDDIKMKFNIAEVPMMKVEESLWYEFTKDERIGASIQGFREVTQADGTKIRIPHIGFSGDLDQLNDMINRILAKAGMLKPVEVSKD